MRVRRFVVLALLAAWLAPEPASGQARRVETAPVSETIGTWILACGLDPMTDRGDCTLRHRLWLEEPRAAIGKSTVEAMQAGAVFGYRGLVREIIARLRSEMAGDPVIVATGGDAALIARGLPEIQVVDPDLTLEGIRLAAVRNLR